MRRNVLDPPKQAVAKMRVGGTSRSGWNINRSEWFLKVRRYQEVRPGVFCDEGYEELQLLEMAIPVADYQKLVLEEVASRFLPERSPP